MKTFTFSLLLLTMVVGLSNAQNVEIPDTNFLYALIDKGVDTDGDSLISRAEAEAVTSLDFLGYSCSPFCPRLVIKSLVGIEAFVNLEILSFVYDQLTSLDVSGCTSLKYLDCTQNELTSLDVSGCTSLKYLDCTDNELTSLDLSNNTALTELYCGGNQLTTLDVSKNTVLESLACGDSQFITSLDISTNTALTELSFYYLTSLYKVCVWESFPAGVTVKIYQCPNVYFTTECDTGRVPIYKHIRIGSTGDPLNGLTVTWESRGPSDSIAWGYTTNLEEGIFKGFKRENTFGNVMNVMSDYTFPSLKAASTIHYVIFDSKDSIWTEVKTFNTASDASNNQFSFTVLGDSRSNLDQWQIISEAILETDFTLFLGDIVSSGSAQADWSNWFEFGEEFITREPIYHTIGNHDDDDSPSGYDNYLNLFTLPGNELYYSFTYGNAVFICLNSLEPDNSTQFNWLLSTLEANKDKTWKFVFTHKPFYTSPGHETDMHPYFNTWWKAFDDYGVDMIFAGHTHNYQRTKPINRNISTTSPVANYGSDEGMGRCQIVSGAAGAPLYGEADPGLWWLERSKSELHFCNIDIDGGILTFKAMNANQVVFDELKIDKRWPIGTSDFESTVSWIYPNPANDQLTVETNIPGLYSIEITSLNGQLIYSTIMKGGSQQIDLSSFQKGLYFITVRSKDFVRTEKIIKL